MASPASATLAQSLFLSSVFPSCGQTAWYMLEDQGSTITGPHQGHVMYEWFAAGELPACTQVCGTGPDAGRPTLQYFAPLHALLRIVQQGGWYVPLGQRDLARGRTLPGWLQPPRAPLQAAYEGKSAGPGSIPPPSPGEIQRFLQRRPDWHWMWRRRNRPVLGPGTVPWLLQHLGQLGYPPDVLLVAVHPNIVCLSYHYFQPLADLLCLPDYRPVLLRDLDQPLPVHGWPHPPSIPLETPPAIKANVPKHRSPFVNSSDPVPQAAPFSAPPSAYCPPPDSSAVPSASGAAAPLSAMSPFVNASDAIVELTLLRPQPLKAQPTPPPPEALPAPLLGRRERRLASGEDLMNTPPATPLLPQSASSPQHARQDSTGRSAVAPEPRPLWGAAPPGTQGSGHRLGKSSTQVPHHPFVSQLSAPEAVGARPSHPCYAAPPPPPPPPPPARPPPRPPPRAHPNGGENGTARAAYSTGQGTVPCGVGQAQWQGQGASSVGPPDEAARSHWQRQTGVARDSGRGGQSEEAEQTHRHSHARDATINQRPTAAAQSEEAAQAHWQSHPRDVVSSGWRCKQPVQAAPPDEAARTHRQQQHVDGTGGARGGQWPAAAAAPPDTMQRPAAAPGPASLAQARPLSGTACEPRLRPVFNRREREMQNGASLAESQGGNAHEPRQAAVSGGQGQWERTAAAPSASQWQPPDAAAGQRQPVSAPVGLRPPPAPPRSQRQPEAASNSQWQPAAVDDGHRGLTGIAARQWQPAAPHSGQRQLEKASNSQWQSAAASDSRPQPMTTPLGQWQPAPPPSGQRQPAAPSDSQGQLTHGRDRQPKSTTSPAGQPQLAAPPSSQRLPAVASHSQWQALADYNLQPQPTGTPADRRQPAAPPSGQMQPAKASNSQWQSPAARDGQSPLIAPAAAQRQPAAPPSSQRQLEGDVVRQRHQEGARDRQLGPGGQAVPPWEMARPPSPPSSTSEDTAVQGPEGGVPFSRRLYYYYLDDDNQLQCKRQEGGVLVGFSAAQMRKWYSKEALASTLMVMGADEYLREEDLDLNMFKLLPAWL